MVNPSWPIAKKTPDKTGAIQCTLRFADQASQNLRDGCERQRQSARALTVGDPRAKSDVQADGEKTCADDTEPETLLWRCSAGRRAGSGTAVDLGHVGGDGLQDDEHS